MRSFTVGRDLRGTCRRTHTGADVDSDAADLVVDHLNLAGVHAARTASPAVLHDGCRTGRRAVRMYALVSAQMTAQRDHRRGELSTSSLALARRAWSPALVHHREEVVHASCLEARESRRPDRRESRALLVVERDRHRAASRENPCDARPFPEDLDVRHPSRRVHEVVRSVAEDLIGDAHALAVVRTGSPRQPTTR